MIRKPAGYAPQCRMPRPHGFHMIDNGTGAYRLRIECLGEPTEDRAAKRTRQSRIFADVRAERDAQDAKFGVQDLPNGTGGQFAHVADHYRRACDASFARREGSFRHVFLEEVWEAMAESDPEALRAELIQAIAVGVKWVEAIDRKAGR